MRLECIKISCFGEKDDYRTWKPVYNCSDCECSAQCHYVREYMNFLEKAYPDKTREQLKNLLEIL